MSRIFPVASEEHCLRLNKNETIKKNGNLRLYIFIFLRYFSISLSYRARLVNKTNVRVKNIFAKLSKEQNNRYNCNYHCLLYISNRLQKSFAELTSLYIIKAA